MYDPRRFSNIGRRRCDLADVPSRCALTEYAEMRGRVVGLPGRVAAAALLSCAIAAVAPNASNAAAAPTHSATTTIGRAAGTTLSVISAPLHDVPLPADYDGDGRADIAVWRPSTGTWYIRGQQATRYGVAGDVPLPADYDGDGRADIAVWRPSTGTWYIRGQQSFPFGERGDIPLAGKFDSSDLPKATPAVYRPRTCVIYVRGVGNESVSWLSPFPCHKAKVSAFPMQTVNDHGVRKARYVSEILLIAVVNRHLYWLGFDVNSPQQASGYEEYAAPGDVPVPGVFQPGPSGYYANLAVWRPSSGTWYVRSHLANRIYKKVPYGISGDIPVPADYSGAVDELDSPITGFAVWRPSTATWYIRGQAPVQWGQRY
jgi:hypothetical protein